MKYKKKGVLKMEDDMIISVDDSTTYGRIFEFDSDNED